MLEKILPYEIYELLKSRFNTKYIYELRVRASMPIVINYYGDYIELLTDSGTPLFADSKLIDYIVSRATDLSLYRYNSQIKKGFISVSGGIRIGLAGDIVYGDLGEVTTIKNFQGLNIRIPHEIKNCASEIYPFIIDSTGIKNTLIVSPPGCGKTTFLRDIARNLSLEDNLFNTLLIDERYELGAVENGKARLDVGLHTDIISGASKEFGFAEGVRALRPDVIITDEIASTRDAEAVKRATKSGVKVIASAHGFSELDLKQKEELSSLISARVFDRFAILSDRLGIGTVESVLNSALEPIWVR